MKRAFLLSAMLVAALGLRSTAQEQARPVKLVVEAEDFAPTNPDGWRVIRFGENYFCDAIGASYISREQLLSAPEQCTRAEAVKAVTIPRSRGYRVWVHYEAPHMYNTRFGLRIEQGGETVFDHAFGGADHIRLWPLGGGLARQWNPGYGGGDNVVWEGYETRLRRGEATFVLYTMDNAEPAAKRNLDVIFLTTDLSDLPKEHYDPFFNELREPGRLFVRVKNPPGAGRSVLLGLSFSYNRRPWGGGARGLGSGG
jgi:hypothetical protein